MHRRVWFLVAVAAAMLGLAGSAAAMRTTESSTGRVLAAAPFAKGWAQVPRTPAARAAKSTLTFAMEQDAGGFNLANQDFTGFWAAVTGETPVIRGAYIIDNKGVYHLDMASKVKATKKYLKIWIRKNANWFWVGHKKLTPVTSHDFIYTWKQFIKPGNNVASTTGYSNIARAKANSKKVVTFFWKKGQQFADFRDLFGYIYPAFALKGLSFNTFWSNCVCGNDGKPISDGPFYLSNWTQGQGVILKRNTHWYGAKAHLKTVVFKLINDENAEIQAMKGGEVDAINPTPAPALSQLIGQKNLVYNTTPGFVQEHIDIEFGPAGSGGGGTHTANGAALLSKQYFRAALAMGLNRSAVVKAIYSSIAPGLKQLQNPEWETGTYANGPYAYFKEYNFNQKAAISTLKSHGCKGGPNTANKNNQKVWTCSGHKAEIGFYTTTAPAREASAAVWQAQLMAIGIKLDVQFYTAQPDFFTNLLPTGKFDLAEYAWVGGPDPSGFDGIYQCVNTAKNLGGQNYKNYCNHTVDKLLAKGDKELNPTTRFADYEAAAKIISHQVAIIPVFARPVILVYKKAIKGGMSAANNPTGEGPTWNIQAWSWG